MTSETKEPKYTTASQWGMFPIETPPKPATISASEFHFMQIGELAQHRRLTLKEIEERV